MSVVSFRSFFQPYRRSDTSAVSSLGTRTWRRAQGLRVCSWSGAECAGTLSVEVHREFFPQLAGCMFKVQGGGMRAFQDAHLVAQQQPVHLLDGRDEAVDVGLLLAHLG